MENWVRLQVTFLVCLCGRVLACLARSISLRRLVCSCLLVWSICLELECACSFSRIHARASSTTPASCGTDGATSTRHSRIGYEHEPAEHDIALCAATRVHFSPFVSRQTRSQFLYGAHRYSGSCDTTWRWVVLGNTEGLQA